MKMANSGSRPTPSRSPDCSQAGRVPTSRSRAVAVLCVSGQSPYKKIPGADCYDRRRGARSFPGGIPVVAHPPCRAWSATCRHLAKPEPGERDLAPWAVEVIQREGGVLEHPAHSVLWDELGLPKPGDPPDPETGLWSQLVHQSWFGSHRRKPTWLLFAGITEAELPELPFRLMPRESEVAKWNALCQAGRSRTPVEMAEWLLAVARASKPGVDTLNPEAENRR